RRPATPRGAHRGACPARARRDADRPAGPPDAPVVEAGAVPGTGEAAMSTLGAAMRETADWPLDLPVSSTRPSTPLGPVCKWCWGEAERRATQPGMGAAL